MTKGKPLKRVNKNFMVIMEERNHVHIYIYRKVRLGTPLPGYTGA